MAKFTNDIFVKREAYFSPCQKYRYALKIMWDNSLPLMGLIGLNPSTADQYKDDPTLRRVRGFAESFGCGGVIMLNLFAYRATDPREMKKQSDPVGVGNTLDDLREWLSLCLGPHIAAWGTHGEFMGRGREVLEGIRGLSCLAKNSDGSPKHPLYLKSDLRPIPFN